MLVGIENDIPTVFFLSGYSLSLVETEQETTPLPILFLLRSTMRQRYQTPTTSEAWIFERKLVRCLLALISTILLIAWPSSICILDSPSKIPSFPAVTAFSTLPLRQEQFFVRKFNPVSKLILNAYNPVVVVGKIIVDEYGDPFPHSEDEQSKKNELQSKTPAPPKTVSIGGGGPQAAFGAAAALAVWDMYYNEKQKQSDSPTPLPPVIFVAPVGSDWTDSETKALEASLGASALALVHNNTIDGFGISPVNASNFPMIQTHLVVKSVGGSDHQDDNEYHGFFTPRIRLWHDSDQICHWYALNDSFGPKGADGLWRNNPSAEDLTSILECGEWNKDSRIVLHAIAETWTGAAGAQLDVLPVLQDENVLFRNRLCFVGIEPVASGESVTKEDAEVAASVLEACCESITATPSCDTVFWCPDRELDDAMVSNELYVQDTNAYGDLVRLAAIRDGPRGSTTRITKASFEKNEEAHIPVAILATKDGAPIDPTGAGNAYSGAMTALLGNDVPLSKAACIATAVGAVVCEHEGLPSQNDWQSTLERIASASREVDSNTV